MRYKEWKKYYKQILDEFCFSIEKDLESARELDELLKIREKINIEILRIFIEGKDVVIFGSGPSLKRSIKKYIDFFIDKVLIAADGATSALMEFCIVPDIIVSDLDGRIFDQVKANERGSLIVIHAHGDNLELIKNNFYKFSNRVLGTTQADPSKFKNLYNFGGFTDGDRAVFLAEHFNAKNIYLIGFDFGGRIGKYSFAKKKDIDKKLKKLKWAKFFIDELNKEKQNIIYL